MSFKAKKRTGCLGTWFAKVTDSRRPAAKNRTRKLCCEMLERRELLSVSVVTGSLNYLTVPVTTTNGSATGTANGTAYQANANLAGTIAYTSSTSATVTGNLNGAIVTPPNSGNFAATIPASGSTVSLNNGAISGSVNVTSPASIGVVSASGTINVSQTGGNNTTITWPQSGTSQLGQWTGTIVATNSTPYNIVLTTPVWHSANESQIDFGFTNAGTWDLNHYGGVSTNVVAYWSPDATLTNATPIGTVHVAWNQASGTASIQGISGSIPAGTNYVLIQGQDSTTSSPDTNLVALNLNAPLVTGVSPSLGPPAGGTTVTITGAGFTGATEIDFGSTAVLVSSNAQIQISADGKTITGVPSPAGAAGTVNVTVKVAGVSSPTSTADQFQYNPWTIVGTGDFGGDTKADILWENTSTGQVAAWIAGGGLLNLGTVPLNQGWALAGVGDFGGDARADILWQNTTTGQVGAWITGDGWLGLGTVPLNQGWTLAGVGDFGGGANADILWQNTTTGQVGAWITGGGWLGLGTAPLNQGWALAGVGDFGGDAKADILWQNTTSGQVGAWITGGGWLGLGTVPLNQGWTLAGVGDYGGNTKADILWQNTTTGQIGSWITGGGWLGLGTAPLNVGWTLVGVGDFGGGANADILWENTNTGQIGAWVTGGSWLNLGVI